MADFATEPPPTLGEMFITSFDSLNGSEIDLRVTPGWNDRPPLLVERGSWRKRDQPTEDPALLKGVSHVSYSIQYLLLVHAAVSNSYVFIDFSAG